MATQKLKQLLSTFNFFHAKHAFPRYILWPNVLSHLWLWHWFFAGAVVKFQCNNTKYPLIQTAKTDKNGYFFITAPKTITSFGAHKCKVFLVSSPLASCNKPSDLHYGLQGASLRPEKPYMADKLPFILYTVGPFAFDPKCPL